jgi:flagellar basal body-associated protein FliL
MPENPTSRQPPQTSRDTSLIIGLVLAGVVALLILAGSVFVGSDQKGVDVTATQPSTSSPTPD